MQIQKGNMVKGTNHHRELKDETGKCGFRDKRWPMKSSEQLCSRRCNRMPAGNVRQSFFEAILDLQLLHVIMYAGGMACSSSRNGQRKTWPGLPDTSPWHGPPTPQADA